ncbi:phosphoribosylformylglycinamidine synthase subunit PurL [Candidatus Woesearchaeota archaeon]|nr:phosphoribosylformylglycinamidine synthase subunit PurL [Candidatus Woesearchaeota archaeon]
MSDKELSSFMKQSCLVMKLDEARKLPSILKRNPTLTEFHIFNTEWSEHTSYKSSKSILKQLPTQGRTVILGPKEDAGIAYWTTHKGERYGIVMSHESHNHPSQVVPYEGAATGIGGNVRDVLCMGARVIACADPLRFGSPNGKNKNKVKYIANGVIDGIAGYGNPLGVPIIAGDVYFNESFDDNCLVNVLTLGLVKEKDIIHSAAPKAAVGYDIIIVGKATDNSGFGGAAFASLILDEEDRESNRGAVQVPDPFLKNVLFRSTEEVFKKARQKGITLGFKDMGAGGIMCATTELVEAAGFGAEIDINRIHTSMHNLPPYIIMCSETQERFTWISPPEFTATILKIYNEDFELPNVAEGAKASVIGKVTKNKDYVLKYNGKVICNADVSQITKGIRYDRKAKEPKKSLKEPHLKEPDDYNEAVLSVLSHPNVASKAACYKHYDTEVQGLTVTRPGEADAGVMNPIHGCRAGIALSADSNPRYTRIDPYMGAVNAVAEAMRNVASVGACPIALTDCLNYGNPEKEEAFYEFMQGVKGISDAAKFLYLKGTKQPVPFISGNVSFYNESAAGKSVDPSPIIGCLGKLDDISSTITMKIKGENSSLFMAGERKDELGGSIYYEINSLLGKNLPKVDFEKERSMLYAITDAIAKRLLLSCHDISDGGMVACLAEMILGGDADGSIGASISLDFSKLKTSGTLFSESPGFIFETTKPEEVRASFSKYNLPLVELGSTGGSSLKLTKSSKEIVNLEINKLRKAWTSGFGAALK